MLKLSLGSGLMRGFLYGQTEYNILNNAVNLDEYINKAKELKFDYLSITDSNLYAFLKFYNKCKALNIKPVIGLEVSISINLEEETFLLYPYNNIGLKNLFKIETLHKQNLLDLNFLTKYSLGINVILVTNKSNLIRNMVSLPDEALEKLNNYKNIFAKFYLGISLQNPNLVKINLDSMALARNIGVFSIYIHQMKYLKPEDKIVYDFLLALNNKKDTENGDYTFFNPDPDFIINNNEVFNNTDNLINEINIEIKKEEVLPKYKVDNAKEYLITLANKGLNKRLIKNNANYDIYKKRLDYELKIISEMHYEDYFLIVWDFIKWSKKNNIYVGPGRGSAGSSLVAYALGITEIDPFKYNLLFERFLNPERTSMPDIDTDFPDDKRDDVINYVTNLYGKYHVSTIMTFGTFSYKSSLRDIARIFKVNDKRIKEINNLLVNNNIDNLLETYKYQTDIYDILYIIKRIDGFPRNISTHAAGIIMAGLDLRDVLPLQIGINDLLQTELEYDDLKQLGLLKMDFLGIRNLTIIANVLKEINLSQKDFRNIPLNDSKVYEMLSRADTLGIFQLESTGIRKVLMKLKPTKFTDLVAVLALYRPGPMDNIDEFIARRHGKKFNYLHEDLKPILEETYGIIVYQEQIILIATKFAGYSLGKADILRRAISDKDLDKMEELREDFIKSSYNRGYEYSLANTIFDLIVKFANYGFNKSHSVAYAVVAYEMSYLKVHYFGTFMAHLLNNVIGATETLKDYINYAKQHRLKVVGPNINVSTNRFVYSNNSLYLPLTCVNGIGLAICNKIVEARLEKPFKSYDDFVVRLKLSEQNITNLIYAGAFRDYNKTTKELIEHKTTEATLIDSLLGSDLIKTQDDYDVDYLTNKEKEVLGFNITYDPTRKIRGYRITNKINPLSSIKLNSKTNAIVKFTNLEEKKTKQGTLILKGDIYDDTTSIPFIIFNDLYQEVKSLINTSNIYLVGLNYRANNDFTPSASLIFIQKIN